MNNQNKNQKSSSQGQELRKNQQQQQQQQQQSSEFDPRSETPSHAGLSKIEAPMSGKKMCNHGYDCDCSTEAAIHASEEHMPKTAKPTSKTARK